MVTDRVLEGLPLTLEGLDHYTLIVADAKTAARFHVEALGFKHLRTQEINAGSAPAGGTDMRNEILELPGMPGRTCVITEGLTDESIFRRYLMLHGAGVHHMAFAVSDLEDAMARLAAADIQGTSTRTIVDPLSGLRQIFIDRRYTGYFIELIERASEGGAAGYFAESNMSSLAASMGPYLAAPTVPDAPAAAPHLDVGVPAPLALDYVADPSHLGRWTTHRTVRRIEGRWREIRLRADVDLDVTCDGSSVTLTWSSGAATRSARIEVAPAGPHACVVRITGPDAARLALHDLLTAELRLLKAELEGRAYALQEVDRRTVEEHHLRVYQRTEP